ncbi:MAG: di-trans,poly-cis-decaprenylcistransferase [Candidatus Saganbacteria bacterium]|nr:di-trans,poly-cis-decaprenylcistransferase [Candidatus Saganbacteria bacterium]
MSEIPQHVAIIMDGNSRWAKARNLPPIAGHKKGVDSLKKIVIASAEAGVKYLTVYAFSTENWGRPKGEVGFIMDLLFQSMEKEIDELNKNNVRIRFLGRLHQFSDKLQKKMQESMNKLEKNSGLNLNVMLSYGSRAEIVDAVNLKLENGNWKPGEKIEEKDISDNLYTKRMPDLDLLIRTANEMRISNFLLWQLAYAEIYVTPVLWPDFGKDDLLAAIKDYGMRERRFGLRK